MDTEAAQQVIDRALEVGVEVGFPRWVPLSAHIRTADGQVTDIDAGQAPPEGEAPRKRCREEPLVDVAASGRTGKDGSVTMRIRDVFCFDVNIEDQTQVWVTATPRSTKPVYITHVVLPPFDPPGPLPPSDPDDVRIRFFAWDQSGQPKPDISFTWRALFVTYDTPVE
jgi:hypothetical protein